MSAQEFGSDENGIPAGLPMRATTLKLRGENERREAIASGDGGGNPLASSLAAPTNVR